mmetsp:Transcript_8251/g.19470  ORF Transcript_8251/g.19470 Transcript_8251/m.19470 type:complete len:236 (+) Transcript_8251:383-1090(+)
MSHRLLWLLPVHSSSGRPASPAADAKMVQLNSQRSAHTLPAPCAPQACWQFCPAVPTANSGKGGDGGDCGDGGEIGGCGGAGGALGAGWKLVMTCTLSIFSQTDDAVEPRTAWSSAFIVTVSRPDAPSTPAPPSESRLMLASTSEDTAPVALSRRARPVRGGGGSGLAPGSAVPSSAARCNSRRLLRPAQPLKIRQSAAPEMTSCPAASSASGCLSRSWVALSSTAASSERPSTE